MITSTDITPKGISQPLGDNASLCLARTSLVLDSIAHKLNNILGTMVGSADMLADDIPADSPLREDMQRLRTAGEQARLFMQRINEFSRSHQQEPTTHAITPLLNAVLAATQATLPVGLEVYRTSGDTTLTVKCAPADIHLIMLFILEYARNTMTPPGNITISLARNLAGQSPSPPILSLIDPTQILRLVCHLDGRIKNRAALDQLFDPVRLEPSDPTALAIYTARHVARKLGGDLLAEDQERQGMSFHIFLPLADQKEPKSTNRQDTATGHGTTTVLLVEDDRSMASVFLRLLSRLGHDVVVEHDGTAALQTFRQNPNRFNLLVTDFFMPEMNGLELIRRLRTTHPTLPVLLCTGQTDSLPEELATMERLLVSEKPMRMNAFTAAIHDLLNTTTPKSA